MEAGPERHPGVERKDDVAGRAPVAAPSRADDEPAADAHHREVRLPCLGPVRLVDDARPQLPDRPQPERLEMAEGGGDLGDGRVRGRAVPRRQVCPDDRGPARVEPGAEALIDQFEGGLDRRATLRRPTEDLADGLDGLDVGLDRQLEPGAGVGARRGRPGPAQPSPSFSSSPPPPCPTDSPASSA